MGQCEHSPSANPRLAGSCVKCGRPITNSGIGPAKSFTPSLASETYRETGFSKDPARDLSYEDDFLTDALRLAERLHGITNHAYPGRVSQRLDIGRARYGDGDFLTKDNITEVLEETPDLAAYAMLELQRLRRSATPEHHELVRMDLVAVAAYGSIADWFAQRAARRLKGLEV